MGILWRSDEMPPPHADYAGYRIGPAAVLGAALLCPRASKNFGRPWAPVGIDPAALGGCGGKTIREARAASQTDLLAARGRPARSAQRRHTSIFFRRSAISADASKRCRCRGNFLCGAQAHVENHGESGDPKSYRSAWQGLGSG